MNLNYVEYLSEALMSEDKKTVATLGIDKKRKDAEGLSKEYKKPKTLKQLSISNFEEKKKEEKILKSPCQLQEDIDAIRTMLVRVSDRQEVVQGCIDRLLSMCLQEVQDDSSEERALVYKKQ